MDPIKKIDASSSRNGNADCLKHQMTTNQVIERMQYLQDKYEELYKILNGNGKPGARQDIAQLKTDLAIIKKEFNELRKLFFGSAAAKGTKDKLEDFIIQYNLDKEQKEKEDIQAQKSRDKRENNWKWFIGIAVVLLTAWVSLDKILLFFRLGT